MWVFNPQCNGVEAMYVDYKEVGRRIAYRRKELGLKQRQVNELAELSDKYLSNIETARSIPSIDVLMKICNVLQTTPDYFLIGAVNDCTNTDFSKLISSKIEQLSFEKQKFVYNFIDWVKDQNIGE